MTRLRAWTRLKKIRVYGAPVYAHWSVFVGVSVLGLLGLTSPIYAGVAIASYIAVIGIHELGHAFVAHRLGYRVAAVRIAAIHGCCEHEAPETEWEDVLVSWGGVAAQFLIAAVVLLAAAAVGDREVPYFGPIVVFLGYLNLMIALVNLAPSQGFDGATAWRIVPLALQHHRLRKRTGKTRSVLPFRKRSNTGSSDA